MLSGFKRSVGRAHHLLSGARRHTLKRALGNALRFKRSVGRAHPSGWELC
jgi:hypothetical protein